MTGWTICAAAGAAASTKAMAMMVRRMFPRF
jgi:hypothetical protein